MVVSAKLQSKDVGCLPENDVGCLPENVVGCLPENVMFHDTFQEI